MRTALLVIVVLVSGVACKKATSDPNGVGPWQFGKSKLKDAEDAGRCLPGTGTEMYCVGMSATMIGKQAAETTVYFGTNAKDSPLLEIALAVHACDPAAAAASLEAVLGPAKESLDEGRLRFWPLSTMFVSAKLPAKGSIECDVNFVTPKDAARIADLRAGK